LEVNAIPEPGQDDGGGFAETGGDVDELRMAFRVAGPPFGFGTVIAFAAGKTALVVVRRSLLCDGLKKVIVMKRAQVWPPFPTSNAKYPVMNYLCLSDICAKAKSARFLHRLVENGYQMPPPVARISLMGNF